MAGRFPPTYSPPPQSQRINDAVAEAERQAKDQLDEARGKIEQLLEYYLLAPMLPFNLYDFQAQKAIIQIRV
jgi:hypothetical protein